jgi:hypothetical protein
LTGGFAYFDEAGNLLAVNAISLAPSETGLLLIGREVTAQTGESAHVRHFTVRF